LKEQVDTAVPQDEGSARTATLFRIEPAASPASRGRAQRYRS
jgi:hypothetical protein